jgi:hypothetical protein
MKGGITSGVVYPSAVRQLSKTHRFRNIGGASVGAIAAAMTAAAEYGRQAGRGTGFREFDAIDRELAREGFLPSLFKPRTAERGVYSIYLAVIRKAGAIRVTRRVLGQAPWVVFPLLAWWLTLAVATWWLGTHWWLVPILVAVWGVFATTWMWAPQRRVNVLGLIGLLLPILWPCLLVLPWVGLRAWRDLSENGFGLVPGGTVALAKARAKWTDNLEPVSDHEGQFGKGVGKPAGGRHVGPEVVETPAEVLNERVAGDDDIGGTVSL